jgi:hypothetical protein
MTAMEMREVAAQASLSSRKPGTRSMFEVGETRRESPIADAAGALQGVDFRQLIVVRQGNTQSQGEFPGGIALRPSGRSPKRDSEAGLLPAAKGVGRGSKVG